MNTKPCESVHIRMIKFPICLPDRTDVDLLLLFLYLQPSPD